MELCELHVVTTPLRDAGPVVDDVPSEPASGRLAGRYRIEEAIGQGGTAFVHAGTQLGTDRRVAIKLLRPRYQGNADVIQRFVREARAAASVRHPHVVDVVDFGASSDGQLFTVMEFLHGENLASTSAREGQLPWPRVRHLALQLCSALDAVHRTGIVHRDVTLANVFRIRRGDDEDFVKLVDFGLARVIEPAGHEPTPRLTSEVDIFGTPAFMAPEQVRRSGDADPRSDVYAVGVVMFALVTGRLPITGRSALEIMDRQLHEPVPSPASLVRSLPAGLEALLLRTLAKDPGARVQSMAELAHAIESIPCDARIDGRPRARSIARRPKLWLVALGLLVFAISAWLAFT